MNSKIPIFQLDLVLLPGEEIELHIFEDRYKDMFRDLQKNHGHGGIIRGQDQTGSSVIGTTFEIIEVLNVYRTGESDVLIRGLEVFEIVNWEGNEESYPSAEIYMHSTEVPAVCPDSLLPLANEVLKVASSNEERSWDAVISLKEILLILRLSTEQKEEFLQEVVYGNWQFYLEGQMKLYILIQNQMRQLKGNFLLN